MQVERCFTGGKLRPGKIIRFIFPTYLTSLFTTLYTIMDGVFVSTYVGTDALAAINIVYPIVNLLSGLSLMFAVGGSTLAAIALGSKNREQASHIFSQCIFWSLLLGGCTSFMCWLQLDGILYFLGATTPTLSYSSAPTGDPLTLEQLRDIVRDLKPSENLSARRGGQP